MIKIEDIQSRSDLFDKISRLEKERRDFMHKAMEKFDSEYYYPQKKVMREYCEKNIGHTWKFTNFGPTGYMWYICTICGARKSEE